MEKRKKNKKQKTKNAWTLEEKGLRELHLLGGAGVSSRVVGINGQKGVYGHGATYCRASQLYTLQSATRKH